MTDDDRATFIYEIAGESGTHVVELHGGPEDSVDDVVDAYLRLLREGSLVDYRK